MYRGLVRGGWMREAWCDDTSVTRQGRWGTESPPQRCVRVIVFALSPPHTHSRPSYVVGCGGAVTGVACLAFPLLDREYVDGRSIGSSDIVQFSFLLLLRARARDRSCHLRVGEAEAAAAGAGTPCPSPLGFGSGLAC